MQQGRTVNFKNTVIIMTSNVGARIITDKNVLGFSVMIKMKKKYKIKEYEYYKERCNVRTKKTI